MSMLTLIVIIIALVCLIVGLTLGRFRIGSRAAANMAAAGADLAAARQESVGLRSDLSARESEAARLRDDLADARTQKAVLNTQLEATRANLEEQRKLLEEARTRLADAFSALSADALAKNNKQFLQLARENFAVFSKEATGLFEQRNAQIDAQIKPLRELLGQYQQRLGEIEKSRNESYGLLREQLGTLAETQRTLGTQTDRLVTALSRPATRGQWGEISLRRLVEMAGMTRWCDFVEQATVDGEDGRLRPDMIIRLPGGHQVVIDCKVPLDAAIDAASASDEETRKACIKRHAQQVRNRFRDLSTKNYWTQFSQSPEFVVMFMPGEAFLYAAAEADASLIEEAIRNRVIIATPTSLIALLRTIAFGWRQEEITEHAEKIQEIGVQLFERLGTMTDHFSRLGKSISSTVQAYNDAIGSVETRLLPAARKMGELGASRDRQLADLSPVETLPRALTKLNDADAASP